MLLFLFSAVSVAVVAAVAAVDAVVVGPTNKKEKCSGRGCCWGAVATTTEDQHQQQGN